MGSLDLTNLFIDPDQVPYRLSDLSVLEAADTYQIPNSNSSQNVKNELQESLARNKSYGNFTLIENSGGLHETMPEPSKSQFLPERDMSRLAADMVIRAKRQMMRGTAPEHVVARVEEFLSKNPDHAKHFTAAVKEIKEAAGLIGNVFIDPTLFSSCPEGVKFMAAAPVKPSFVLEMHQCKGCIYHKQSGTEQNCILFQKRIEARVPWHDKKAMQPILQKALVQQGVTAKSLLPMKKYGNKEILRALFMKRFALEEEYKGEQKEAPAISHEAEPDYKPLDLVSVVTAATLRGAKILTIIKKVSALSGSGAETVRIVKEGLARIGAVSITQLPCPVCEMKGSSIRGLSLLRHLPRDLVVVPGRACASCNRDFSGNVAHWNRPVATPGMPTHVQAKVAAFKQAASKWPNQPEQPTDSFVKVSPEDQPEEDAVMSDVAEFQAMCPDGQTVSLPDEMMHESPQEECNG